MPRVTLPTTRFTVDELERLVEAEVFDGRRVELINGRIYRKAPQLTPHMAAVSKCSVALNRAARATDWVVIQGTLRLGRNSAPDPDLFWLPVPLGTPAHEWPLPILVIEVSDTTYRKDSGPKLRLYARAGVRDYWVLNLKADRIEVYRDPANPTGRLRDCHYASVTHHARGQSIPLLARPEVALAADELLP